MHDIVLRNTADRRSQLVQNISEQTEIDVHVNRFSDVLRTRMFQSQRNSSRIEMRLESRRAFESSYVELVWVFENDLGLVGDRFCHRLLIKNAIAASSPNEQWLLCDRSILRPES